LYKAFKKRSQILNNKIWSTLDISLRLNDIAVLFQIFLNRMVILVYKKTDKNSFAIECTLETKISVILEQLI
jgi:hypothetical protein